MGEARLSRRSFGRLAANLSALSLLGSALPAFGAGLPAMKAAMFPFATAPFPYHGTQPDDGSEFMDVNANDGRLGHTAPRGGVYYEDQTYSDNRVLVAMPAGFDLRKKAAIVVFFHGNNATLNRDVIQRQHVLDQLQASGLNAAFIAPQFAVNALDSSSGRFWVPGAFAQFMAEAAGALAKLYGARNARSAFAAMPIILVGYSGGYNPAAYASTVGGVARRIRGMILLDAIVGEDDRFVAWIEASRRYAFFFSAYSDSAEAGNADVMQKIAAKGISYSTNLPRAFVPGGVNFVAADGDHDDYVTTAWVNNPLTWCFNRVVGYPR